MNNKYRIIMALMAFLPLFAMAQNITIKGQVFDDMEEPLMGATIVEVNNASNGTVTDLDGKFSINVRSKDSQLKITFVGYEDNIVTVGNNTNLVVRMVLSSNVLEEVVAVAYGKQKRITHVGATSQITGKELRQSPAASIQNSLAGKIPGLFQQQISGQPGNDAARIYIRGISNYDSNVSRNPLVMIDDIETSFSTLSQLDPNEIENLAILKDASSTAIYGVKGANGVILVTTRRGKEEAARVTFRSEVGFQSPTIYNKILGSYDALMVLKEYYENQGLDPNSEMPGGYFSPEALEHFRLGDQPHRYPNVDWYDEVMRKNTLQLKENVEITGGTKNVKYFLSLGYLHQDGILKGVSKNEDFENNYYLRRYNLRSNIDINVTKDFLIRLNASAILSEVNEPYLPDPRSTSGGEGWTFWRRMNSGILTPWYYAVRNEDGSYGGSSGTSTNPLMMLEYGGYKRKFNNNVNGNITGEYKLDFITKGLAIKASMALTNTWGFNRSLTRNDFPDYTYNRQTGKIERISSSYVIPPLAVNANTTVAPAINPYRKITSQIILTYGRQFGNHNVSALGLMIWDTSRNGGNEPQNFKGYSGRISYDYKYRYILELNAGYNGSDRFKAKNKYGFFPAISAGWNISEEPFFKDALNSLYIVDFLKVRGSYGIVGTDAFSSSFRNLYDESYSRGTNAPNQYYFGENPVVHYAIYPGSLGNDNVRWAKEKKLDLGFELRVFNNRLSIEYNYFKNERYDILTTRRTIPQYTGLTSSVLPPVNLGRVENKGHEIEATFRDKIAQVNYFVKGTMSTAKNKILERDEPNSVYPLQMTTGRPIGQIFGFIADGFYMDQAEIDNGPEDRIRGTKLRPGDLKYRDISGPNGVPDGIVDDYDIGPIGNPETPQVTYGLSTGFSYKGFDFSILFQGSAKGSMLASQVLQVGNVNGKPREIHQKAWSEQNKYNAEFPVLGGNSWHSSTYWLRPSDYIRLKNIEIGYTLPKSWISKLGMHSARLYGNGMNLFTWSKMKIYDVDPESQTSSISSSSTYSNYPQMKLFNFGLQVTF